MKEIEQDQRNGKPWEEIEMKLLEWCNEGRNLD